MTLAHETEALARRQSHYQDNAQAFQKQIVAVLRCGGWECFTEVQAAPCQDGRRGRIDVMARRKGETVLIECDSRSPRQKSLRKLRATDCSARVVVLRRAQPLHMVGNVAVFGVEVLS